MNPYPSIKSAKSSFKQASKPSAKQRIQVRVMPGNPKSPNPAQRKPYVVQRRGADAVSKSGKLINRNLEESHIPLGEFEFKGW